MSDEEPIEIPKSEDKISPIVDELMESYEIKTNPQWTYEKDLRRLKPTWSLDFNKWPAYGKRMEAMRELYFSGRDHGSNTGLDFFSSRPMTNEEFEAIIRASFKLVPLSKEEKYTEDDVIRCCIQEKRHLKPSEVDKIESVIDIFYRIRRWWRSI